MVAAQAPDLADQPYNVHLVVLLAEHRFLSSEYFQEQFPRELAQRVQVSLGPLARVNTATAHPLAAAIRRDGLDAAFDGYEELSNRRTYFLTVRFEAGQFHVASRFFDGLTGLAGPSAQTTSTGDRSRLAPLAAHLVADGFPLVGQVQDAKKDNVTLRLFGGVGAKLPTGSVMMIAKLDNTRSTRLPWAVLETTEAPTAGRVACQFWHRFADVSLAPSPTNVCRALVLPTRTGPLRLQVLDKATSRPLAGIGVTVNAGKRDVTIVTDAAGMVTTPDIAKLAHVRIARGTTPLAQFPVPIVDDRLLVCEVSANEEAEAQEALAIRRQQFLARLVDTLQIVDQRLAEQRVLLGQSLEKCLEHAQWTLRFLDGEIIALRAERNEIVDLMKTVNPKATPESDKGLARLKQLRDIVEESTKNLAKAIVDRDTQTEKQKQAVKLLEAARIHESQAEFDEAIQKYREALQLLPDQKAVQDKLTSLERAWAIKDESHKQARQYLVKTWPKLDVEALKESLAMADEALKVCRKSDDHLSPRVFLRANVDHLKTIGRIVDKLKNSRNAEDRKRAQEWSEPLQRLRQISQTAIELAATDEKKTP